MKLGICYLIFWLISRSLLGYDDVLISEGWWEKLARSGVDCERGREEGGCKIYDFSAWSDWQDRLEFRSDQPPARCVAAQPQFIGTSFGQWSLLVDAKKDRWIFQYSSAWCTLILLTHRKELFCSFTEDSMYVRLLSVCLWVLCLWLEAWLTLLWTWTIVDMTCLSRWDLLPVANTWAPDLRASHHDMRVMTSDQRRVSWWHDDSLCSAGPVTQPSLIAPRDDWFQ